MYIQCMADSAPFYASNADDIDPALVEAMRSRVVKRKPQDYAKRKAGPGRPKGHPKTGGKKAGTPNLMSPEFREWLMDRAKPFELLADICAGKEIEDKDGKRKPTTQERMRAAETLTRKLLPDLAATTLTGKDGGPLVVQNPNGLPDEEAETDRVMAFMFRAWQERKKATEKAEQDKPRQLPANPTPAQITHSQPSIIAALAPPAEGDITEPEQPAVLAVGHSQPVGNKTIHLVERLTDRRERWDIRDSTGQRVAGAFGMQAAEAKARAMSEAGQ